jgi:hypothetical protein
MRRRAVRICTQRCIASLPVLGSDVERPVEEPSTCARVVRVTPTDVVAVAPLVVAVEPVDAVVDVEPVAPVVEVEPPVVLVVAPVVVVVVGSTTLTVRNGWTPAAAVFRNAAAAGATGVQVSVTAVPLIVTCVVALAMVNVASPPVVVNVASSGWNSVWRSPLAGTARLLVMGAEVQVVGVTFVASTVPVTTASNGFDRSGFRSVTNSSGTVTFHVWSCSTMSSPFVTCDAAVAVISKVSA